MYENEVHALVIDTYVLKLSLVYLGFVPTPTALFMLSLRSTPRPVDKETSQIFIERQQSNYLRTLAELIIANGITRMKMHMKQLARSGSAAFAKPQND